MAPEQFDPPPTKRAASGDSWAIPEDFGGVSASAASGSASAPLNGASGPSQGDGSGPAAAGVPRVFHHAERPSARLLDPTLQVKPTRRLKRAARYLAQHPELSWCVDGDGDVLIVVWVDSDWGGDQKSIRSTSGGVLCYGGCVVKTWARLQGSVSLSSSEAEYYSMVSGVCEALGLQSFLLELGETIEIEVRTDSLSARDSVEKRGLLRVRHLAIRYHFIKDLAARKNIKIAKVESSSNAADMLTKIPTDQILQRCFALMSMKR